MPSSARLVIAALLTLSPAVGAAQEMPLSAVGLELGAQGLALSNGPAFGLGPMARIVANVQDETSYVAQVTYGYSRHALVDPSQLFFDEIASTEATGSATMHMLGVGAKAYPLAGEDGSGPAIQPFVGSNFGLVLASGHVAFEGTGVEATTLRLKVLLEVAGGAEYALSEHLELGLLARVGALPSVRQTDDTARIEALLLLHPALVATWRL